MLINCIKKDYESLYIKKCTDIIAHTRDTGGGALIIWTGAKFFMKKKVIEKEVIESIGYTDRNL